MVGIDSDKLIEGWTVFQMWDIRLK